MKHLLILSIFTASVFGYDRFYYKNETMIVDNKSFRISGSVLFNEEEYFFFYATDTATMIPYSLTADIKSSESNALKAECKSFEWGEWKRDDAYGRLEVEGYLTLKGTCKSAHNKIWEISITNLVYTGSAYYDYKVAGLRARSLIGLTTKIYKDYSIVCYSIADCTLDNIPCEDFYVDFPEEKNPKPGFIIVGKNADTCGLLDNEGTKFVYANHGTGKVAYAPLSSAPIIFPEGFEYRSYADINAFFRGRRIIK